MTARLAALVLTGRRRTATQGRSVAEGVVTRPLHTVVFALVAGLLCGPRAPAVAVALATGLLAAGALLATAKWRACGGRARAPCAPRAGGGEPEARSDHAGLGTRGTRGYPSNRFDAPDPMPGAVGRRAALLAVAAALAVLLGAAIGDVRAAALDSTRLGPELGHAVTGSVVVHEAPRTSRYGGWSALVELRGEPVLLRVAEPTADALPGVGTVLAVVGGLRAPSDFAVSRHAHAELRATAATVEGTRGGPAGALDGVRRRAEAALDRGLPPAAAGLLRGMVLGQDDALPDGTRDAFRAAGLSHLVAASGTNVVLLAALAMALGTALGLGLSGRLWLVLALIAAYVPLAGGGASIQRAGVMGAAAVAAGLVGRPTSRWYALGGAAALTLIVDPRAAGEPGWQLSFVAVVSLLVLAPSWRRALTRRGLPRALAEVTAMTAAATLATAPVVAVHFGQASLVSVPANVLAAPAVAPVMWLGVVGAAVGQLLVLGGPVAAVAGTIIDGLDALAGFPLGYLAWIATTAASVPGAVVDVGPWAVVVVVAVVLSAASSGRVRRVAPAAAALAAAAWICLVPPPAAPAGVPAGLRLTFLDVGQGDATLVQDGKRSVLVDAGVPESGIVELLQHAGVRRLDLLVATHAENDHAGGTAAVVSALPVNAILDGRDGVRRPAGDAMAAAAQARGVRLIVARAGQELRLGGLRLRVLWPRPEAAALHAAQNPNDRAIVLEVAARGARALLAADAESDVLSRIELRPVDVLKVSHHGSADPGLPALLDRVRPQVAGIEVGAGNTYGHPAPSTLAALARVPVVVRTDRDGTVRLDRIRAGRWEVRAHA